MLNKFRNPLPMFAKVYKYEFLNTYRFFVPFYAILIIVGFLFGFSNKKSNSNTHFEFNFPDSEKIIPYDENISPAPNLDFPESDTNILQIKFSTEPTIQFTDYSFSFNSSNNMGLNALISGLLGTTLIVLLQIALIVHYIQFGKRFKKGLFEDESYLNLSLPVTAGEHLWGRFLCYITWILLCLVILCSTFFVSTLFSVGFDRLKEGIVTLNNYFFNGTKHLIPIYFLGASSFISWQVSIVALIICIICISHIFKKEKALVVIISIITIAAISRKLFGLAFTPEMFQNFNTFKLSLWKSLGINFLITAAFLVVSHVILKFKINIE